jgi:uncharacterized ferredoxin-like protein
MDIDMYEILLRIIKYLFEGLAVGLAAFLTKKLSLDYVIILGATAAATFAILDMFSPNVSSAARIGTGFGIGSQFTGIRIG